MTYQPIENYGVVGDLHTVALVGMDGSIDFMCFPHFDSPTIFNKLLDAKKGGSFCLMPVLDDVRHKQLYLPDTNILLSRFLSTRGVAEISDFMPVETKDPAHEIVRRAKTIRGEITFRMTCKPAFDYGRAHHRVEQRDGQVLFVPESSNTPSLRLRHQVPVTVRDGAAQAEFTLQTGQTAAFILEEVHPGRASPSSAADFVPESFKATLNYWHEWVARSTYRGRWREMVNRSALALKLLTSWDSGSIVAAPTFGLPEAVGGERNWDYRYTWIRDASFTLYGLIRLGYTDEAAHFMHWIEDRCAELERGQSLQTVYGLDGRRDLHEVILPHLEGYRGSAPVRIGNAAYDQLQLDIYGELMDSVYLYDKHGSPISYDVWSNLIPLIDWVTKNWDRPDEGIWEVRGGQQHFLYSRLMCWVALDRALRLVRKRSYPAPTARWLSARDQIYQDIFTNFWDEKRKAFVQHKGTRALDAASLLMPLVRFISPTDPRWLSHMNAIEDELVYDSLVHRYLVGSSAPDGFVSHEGTFSMCTFWYVEGLSRSGQLQKARLYFEKMLGYANHLGLYAEELGLQGEHLGNFPQAFTHLALISAAYDLDRRLSASGQRT
jgi:GH15 family glucan-1,4-alpha-glucosidase